MAIFRSVHVSFWNDTKVVDSFTKDDKYFMLYLLTNPQTNLIGCYEISFKQMSYDLDLDKNEIKALLERLEKELDVIIFSKSTNEILIKNWAKYNWTKSTKLIKPIREQIEKIKNKDLKNKLYAIGYQYHIYTIEELKKYGINTISNRETYPIDTTVSVSVTDTDTDTVSVTDTDLFNYYMNNINLTPGEIEIGKLEYWIECFKPKHNEIIKYAIDICLMKQIRNISYLDGILNNWKKSNYKSVEEIKEKEKSKINNETDDKEFIMPFDYDWLNGEENEKRED